MPLAKTQIDMYAHVFISPTKIEIAIGNRRWHFFTYGNMFAHVHISPPKIEIANEYRQW